MGRKSMQSILWIPIEKKKCFRNQLCHSLENSHRGKLYKYFCCEKISRQCLNPISLENPPGGGGSINVIRVGNHAVSDDVFMFILESTQERSYIK